MPNILSPLLLCGFKMERGFALPQHDVLLASDGRFNLTIFGTPGTSWQPQGIILRQVHLSSYGRESFYHTDLLH